MNKFWLIVPAGALAVWALSRLGGEIRCEADQILTDGVCKTIADPWRATDPGPSVQHQTASSVEPKIVDPWKEYPQATDAVVTVNEDQVARMNAEQDAAFEASRARRQARQDMRDAAAEALRDERKRNDDY